MEVALRPIVMEKGRHKGTDLNQLCGMLSRLGPFFGCFSHCAGLAVQVQEVWTGQQYHLKCRADMSVKELQSSNDIGIRHNPLESQHSIIHLSNCANKFIEFEFMCYLCILSLQAC